MAGEADAMLQVLLAKTDTLPQAALRDLVSRGVILSVMTFEDHMNPQVHWIEPEEFGRAFEELTDGENIMADDTHFEAAFTAPNDSYPPFINARKGSDPFTVDITVRSAADAHPPRIGETAKITMDLQDFDQWVANLQRLRQALD